MPISFQKAFTVRWPGRVNVLMTVVGVFHPLTKEEADKLGQFPIPQVQAIWDTGATGTVITKNVASILGLKPIGMKKMSHAGGTSDVNEYLVNIALPNMVIIPGVRVTEGVLPAGTEVLIGMDIIARGDFAVTHVNADGGTTMSFCMPSTEEIDFLPRAQTDMIKKTGNRQERRSLGKKKRQ